MRLFGLVIMTRGQWNYLQEYQKSRMEQEDGRYWKLYHRVQALMTHLEIIEIEAKTTPARFVKKDSPEAREYLKQYGGAIQGLGGIASAQAQSAVSPYYNQALSEAQRRSIL